LSRWIGRAVSISHGSLTIGGRLLQAEPNTIDDDEGVGFYVDHDCNVLYLLRPDDPSVSIGELAVWGPRHLSATLLIDLGDGLSTHISLEQD